MHHARFHPATISHVSPFNLSRLHPRPQVGSLASYPQLRSEYRPVPIIWRQIRQSLPERALHASQPVLATPPASLADAPAPENLHDVASDSEEASSSSDDDTSFDDPWPDDRWPPPSWFIDTDSDDELAPVSSASRGAAIAGSEERAALFRAIFADSATAIDPGRLQGLALNTPDANGMTFLHAAAHKDNLPLARTLLQSGADPNATDSRHATPLHWAASRSASIAEILPQYGADLSHEDQDGNTALIIASRAARADVVQELLDYVDDEDKAWLDHQNKRGISAISAAVSIGDAETVRSLATAGADVSSCANTKKRMTPLMLAAQSGRADIVGILLEFPIDVNRSRLGNITALHDAVATGSIRIATQLLVAGADVNYRRAFHRLETPMLHAISRGDQKMVMLLLAHDAKLNRPYVYVTPTMYVRCAPQEAEPEFGGRLLKKAPGKPMLLHIPQPALAAAAAKGDAGIVEILLASGADINFIDLDHSTALSQARAHRHHRIVELLLSKGALDAPHGQGGPQTPGASSGRPSH